ncbi:MAG: metal-dependent transcriptional regulator [Chitinophagaceae bacterium]|nr:metal-dependent transcriptional regulator [Chitinophagaceae bacterium]
MYSVSEENYLKAVFYLQQQDKAVTTNAIAANMKTKPASVTDMLKKLKAKKMIEYERYRGVRLTANGKKTALGIIRRHRLWEFFLVNKIGFGWDEVHEIAEQLEHVQHPALIEKLDEFLGKPAFDPHGDPIPDVDGKMAQITSVMLSALEVGKSGIFSSVGMQTPDLMQMLQHKKLQLGDEVKVIERFDFDQSMEIEVNRTVKCSLSYKLARFMMIKEGR